MLSVGPQPDKANFGRVGRLLRSWPEGSEPDIEEEGPDDVNIEKVNTPRGYSSSDTYT